MDCHSAKKEAGSCPCDHGPAPFTANIPACAGNNRNFRTAFWTGQHLQMTLMCIPIRGDIGLEMHPDTDQYIRVEQGQALVCMGGTSDTLDRRCRLRDGDGVFVPSGTWHNIVNTGSCPLKLSSVYDPPHHPQGTIHCTKADAQREEGVLAY